MFEEFVNTTRDERIEYVASCVHGGFTETVKYLLGDLTIEEKMAVCRSVDELKIADIIYVMFGGFGQDNPML